MTHELILDVLWDIRDGLSVTKMGDIREAGRMYRLQSFLHAINGEW